MTLPNGAPPITVVRSLLGTTRRPLAEFLHQALATLMMAFDARCVFLARFEEDVMEVVDVTAYGEPAPAKGMRVPLHETFNALAGPLEVINLRDASKGQPARLALQQRLQVTGYLGVPVPSRDPQRAWGSLGIIARGPHVFSPAEAELAEVVAAILATRLDAPEELPRAARAPLSAIRMASDEIKQPLAILRGYADMLQRNEVPAGDMPQVAARLATQSETVVRVVDQVLLLARLPLELSFTIRVDLGAVVRSVADRTRGSVQAKGMELRVQLDADGEVWGDPTLLEAAIEEMVSNVLRHAPSASVVQLRVRRAAPDRFQVMVKDDGPGISADRLAQLFTDAEEGDPPERGHGIGLYLLRRVAQAHGGGAWANSLEGKGTTFYLELPAASPDGEAVRASASGPAPA